MKYTLKDETLEHQVVLYTLTVGMDVQVSCNCLRQENHRYISIGSTHSLDETRDLYNNPENHDKPFKDSDKILLGRKSNDSKPK